MQAYFQNNPVLVHLTDSYIKNYKQKIQMEQIEEENANTKLNQSGTEGSFLEYSFDIINNN